MERKETWDLEKVEDLIDGATLSKEPEGMLTVDIPAQCCLLKLRQWQTQVEESQKNSETN